jgi:hypothetical protein
MELPDARRWPKTGFIQFVESEKSADCSDRSADKSLGTCGAVQNPNTGAIVKQSGVSLLRRARVRIPVLANTFPFRQASLEADEPFRAAME